MKYETNKDNLLYIQVDKSKDMSTLVEDRYDDIVSSIQWKIRDWSYRRRDTEYLWKYYWAHYFSTPQSSNYLRREALSIGQTEDENDWRHKVHTGKGYDLVETVNSYLQAAFFPNTDWFDLEPMSPMAPDEWKDRLMRVKAFMRTKLDEAYFEDFWDIFCRQLCVIGTSVLALPWRYDVKPVKKNVKVRTRKGEDKLEVEEQERVIYNGLDVEVIDMFDFYLDPDLGFSSYIQADCIRRIWKTKAQVVQLIREGVYTRGDEEKVLQMNRSSLLDYNSDKDRQDTKWMLGLEYYSNDGYVEEDIELWEYWGNLCLGDIEYKDVVVTLMNDHILNIEQNPFWDGKPFVVGTYVNTQGSPYGTGLLQPVIGQLHQLYVIQNHRLDVSELTINPMYQVVNDGTIDLENLYSSPGKLVLVDQIGNIASLSLDKDNSISVTDEQLMENRIDKTSGVGNYIGVNSGRDAERVTAQEVQAQRDAGGNRLNSIHAHIEKTSLKCFLHKCYRHMQQFVTEDQMVKTVGGAYGIAYDFWLVGVDELAEDYEILPLGATHITDKEYDIKNAVDFTSIMASSPELSQRVNWDSLAEYIARKFLRDKWEKFINLPQEQQADPMMQQEQQLPPQAVPSGGAVPPPQGVPPEQAGVAAQQIPGVAPNTLAQEMYGIAGQPGHDMMNELTANPVAYEQFLKSQRSSIYSKKKGVQK